MRNRIKLPNIDFSKVSNAIAQAPQSAVKFVGDHKTEFFTGAFLTVVVDNIRVRLGLKKAQKVFKESSLKQQSVLRKHEAEINVLKAESDKAQEATKKVEQLEQIVKNMTEGDT